MAHTIIIGAGTGGMSGAYELRKTLGKDHRITVINENDYFQFIPSNPWVAVGWRKRPQTTFSAGQYLKKKDIDFIAQTVTEIRPEANQVVLADGQTLDYDYLVVATGPKLNFAAIEGAGPEHNSQSICSIDHAEKCYQDVEKLCANPGPVVVGALPGASCFGPAYEYAFVLDKELRKRKMRDKVPMYYVTPEPYMGHLGLGGVGDSKTIMESELRQRHIKWTANSQITRVEDGKVFFDELSEDGELKKQHELEFTHSMLLPSFAGVDAVAAVSDMCNPKGFVLIDDKQRNPTYNNIFSAGVCVAIPPVEVTPVPTGAPKTGYMIESMWSAICGNIKEAIAGKEPTHVATWNAFCLADMGDTGAAFIAVPQIPPRNVTWMKKGRWVHWMKVWFERYFIRKMKRGTAEPAFEKYILRIMRVTRLQ